MTKQDVYYLCHQAGEKYQLDPMLLLAICEQESSYLSDAVRLENGFLRKYVMPLPCDTITKIMLATSYGLMQTMGESLRELGWLCTDDYTVCTNSINAYLRDPALQVDCGAQWFTRKLKAACGNVEKALGFWNGDRTGMYALDVLNKRKKLLNDVTLTQVQHG